MVVYCLFYVWKSQSEQFETLTDILKTSNVFCFILGQLWKTWEWASGS